MGDGPLTRALVLYGPPGSGKGTQAQAIRSCLGVAHISTGNMLREQIESGDALGKQVGEIMRSGGLVSDDLVNKMVELRIQRSDCTKGFILDGYPRTVAQAQVMRGMLDRLGIPLTVVHLNVEYNEIVDRLGGRRSCPECGQVYNLKSNPPQVEGICDKDGAKLVMRADDDEAVIRSRFKSYEDSTRPVLDYFREAGLTIVEVDGTGRMPADMTCGICKSATFCACPKEQ